MKLSKERARYKALQGTTMKLVEKHLPAVVQQGVLGFEAWGRGAVRLEFKVVADAEEELVSLSYTPNESITPDNILKWRVEAYKPESELVILGVCDGHCIVERIGWWKNWIN